MTQTFLKGAVATVHRIDVPCARAGFTQPPCSIHLKFVPNASGGWTLLAHAAAGKPAILAPWLRQQPGMTDVQPAPGIAPKLLRAQAAKLPGPWAEMESFVRVHHLDLAPDGSASWFVEGVRERIIDMIRQLDLVPHGFTLPSDVRCRPVLEGGTEAPLSRRQFEALSSAVALGYYEIPHRLDLRDLAARTGISLGSVSELLRRAEGLVLTRYVDANLMRWPAPPKEHDDVADPVRLDSILDRSR